MNVDFDDKLDAAERCDGDPRRAIVDALHPFSDDSIDGVAMAPIRQVDRYLDDVFQLRARLFQHRFDIVHGLRRLSRRITWYGFALKVPANLTHHEDLIAGSDRLAE